MSKYPRIGSRNNNTEKGNNEYNWRAGCCICKKPFGEDEKFIRVDVQTWYMRGDDDVFNFHKECEPKKNLDLITELYKSLAN